jgi:WD40 repeat protein/serine/threonine protein kinase
VVPVVAALIRLSLREQRSGGRRIMNPGPNRAKEVFVAALRLAPELRQAYLTEACGADDVLRQRVWNLLAADRDAGSFLKPAGEGLLATSNDTSVDQLGAVIGPYKLLQQIGEGGMGTVYMAEQTRPVQRKVALKIIKPGMDSKQVIARFEAERQALAMMDHQSIARVLDGGATTEGRPYFVMELVHGVPITQFCDERKLTPRERLALFAPVCHAIQHAHQKGIIHRDIKPSNVMVTMYDDRPVPKVIDFGVAKAIEQRLTEKTMFTQYGAVIGTFEYMSPEQAEMNAFGVDTRSDIYSLGVLLYELLTGTTPLERQRLREAAYDELVRLIKEEEAPRPSARLSSSHNLPKIAADRNTEPARLSKLVKGEIDWIVMKCLEKDRSRRYDTASALARDVERYLADEPVEACPPSAGYRLRKFARKHRAGLTTATGFAMLLVAGLVASILLTVWATSAEYEANQQRIASDEAKQDALHAKRDADRQRDEARLDGYASGMRLAQYAWDGNNIVLARDLLDHLPTEAGGKPLRGFEWNYLSRLCHAEVLTLQGPGFGERCVAFNPDGSRLAMGCFKTVQIRDSVNGKELLSLGGHTHYVRQVIFSPDGRRLLSSSYNGTVKIWDSVTGQELATLKGGTAGVQAVSFSPDGTRVAWCRGETVTIASTDTGDSLHTLKEHVKQVRGLAFSPDGRHLASCSFDHCVKVWDVMTGKAVHTLTGHTRGVESVAFSPGGKILASGDTQGCMKIWDAATGQPLHSLTSTGDEVRCLAFSPDDRRLASAGTDRLVTLWDCATGNPVAVLKGHTGVVSSLDFSRDGKRLASGSPDHTVKIWSTAAGTDRFTLKGHTNTVLSVAFSPDGRRLASGSMDRSIRIWDSATGQTVRSLRGHAGWASSVAFSPDGQRLASGGSDDLVKIWDPATGKEVHSLMGHSGWVWGVAFSPDGKRVASGSRDNSVMIWDSETGKLLQTFKGHTGWVWSVVFSPDGTRLASASYDKTVKIWDCSTAGELMSLDGHTAAVTSVAFDQTGNRLVTGGQDNAVKVWDGGTGKQLVSFTGHAGWVWGVAFSPDGRRVISGGDDQATKVWDVITGKELLSLRSTGRQVRSLAYRPDGECLASGNGDGTIDLWETSLSVELQELRAQLQSR